MAKALTSLFSTQSRLIAGNSAKLCNLSQLQTLTTKPSSLKFVEYSMVAATSRTHCTLSAAISQSQRKSCFVLSTNQTQLSKYSTEVDKEISKFLEKEIQYENSRSSGKLPTVSGFDITTDDADVTLTKTIGSEKIVVRLTVNGAIDSIAPEGQQSNQSAEEPPQMVCRPPFEVEVTKGDGTVLALQCSFPAGDDMIEETTQQNTEIEDQFEIQEVAIHGGEWKDTTFSVSAATMDAELFDLLMDMLDERGINDEFIAHLVDYCTAYENQKYIGFLNSLKAFADK